MTTTVTTKCAFDVSNLPGLKMTSVPELAEKAVLVKSSTIPDDTPKVQGYDWSKGVDYNAILDSYLTSGFQATNFGKAVLEINKMVSENGLKFQ